MNSAHSTWNSALAVATAVAVIQVSGLVGQGREWTDVDENSKTVFIFIVLI